MIRYILFLLLPLFLYANIGKITSIRGDVQIQRDSQKIKAKLGTTLEKNDFIKTSKNAKVQIVFTDKTIFTIGKDSTLDIAEYLYDESKPKKNAAQFNVLKGAFSSITGRIGKINKSKFKLKTKSAAIGLRGTTIKANQELILCTSGAITVTTADGSTVRVEAGERTDVSSGSPTKPTIITKTDIIRIGLDDIKEDTKGTSKGVIDNKIEEPKKIVDVIPENKKFYGIPIKDPEELNGLNDTTGIQDKPIAVTLKGSSITSTGTVTDESISGTTYKGELGINNSSLSIVDDTDPTKVISKSLDENIAWGHWNNDPTRKWVAGQATNSEHLDNLRNSTSTTNAQYNGNVMGTTNNGGDILMDADNMVKVNFKLGGGQNSFDGEMKFNTAGGQTWDMTTSSDPNYGFTGTTIGNSNKFKSNSVAGKVTGTGVSGGLTSITSGDIEGQFYGPNAEAIGGTVNLNTGDGNQATGVLKAK